MLKNSSFLVIIALLASGFASSVFAESFPLSIQSGDLYFSQGTLLGRVAVCNIEPMKIGYTLRVENLTVNQTYYRNLLVDAETCGTVDLTFNRDFYTESRMGDRIRMALKISGKYLQSNYPYGYTSFYETVINEHLTAYSKSKISSSAELEKKVTVPKKTASSGYTIRGKVVYKGQRPAADVPVKIIGDDGRLISQTYTDRNGRYTFTRVPLPSSDSYSAVAEVADFTQASQSIDLRNTIQIVDFDLRFARRVYFSYRYLPEGDRFFDDMAYINEGTASLYANADSALKGFDFESGSVVNRREGVVYVEFASGGEDLSIYATHQDSGAIDLGEGPITAVRFAPYGGYIQVPTKDYPQKLIEGHNYAIYDKVLDTYAVMHIDRITLEENMVYPSYSRPYYNATFYDQNQAYVVHGRVTDEDGFGLGSVRVRVYTFDASKVVAGTYTNDHGDFDFSNLILNRDTRYAIDVYYADHDSVVAQSMDMNNRNQAVNFKLYYPRRVDFSFKYNLTGSRTFGANDYYTIDSARVITDVNGSGSAGYDFANSSATTVSGGAFYMFNDAGKVKIYGNNMGQGGAIELGSGSVDYVKSVPGSGYNRFGVEAKEGYNYAIYDEKHKTYAVIHIDRIMPER